MFLLIGLAGGASATRQTNFTGRALLLAGAIGASLGKVFYCKGLEKIGTSKATSRRGRRLSGVYLSVNSFAVKFCSREPG